jgi:hypothetical protein
LSSGQWEQAHRLASKYLRSDEVAEMYINQAQSLEGQGKWRDAERLYIAVAEPDLAITMYKNHRHFDQVRPCFQISDISPLYLHIRYGFSLYTEIFSFVAYNE